MERLGIHNYPNKFVRDKFPGSCSSKQEQGTSTSTCGTKLSRSRVWRGPALPKTLFWSFMQHYNSSPQNKLFSEEKTKVKVMQIKCFTSNHSHNFCLTLNSSSSQQRTQNLPCVIYLIVPLQRRRFIIKKALGLQRGPGLITAINLMRQNNWRESSSGSRENLGEMLNITLWYQDGLEQLKEP